MYMRSALRPQTHNFVTDTIAGSLRTCNEYLSSGRLARTVKALTSHSMLRPVIDILRSSKHLLHTVAVQQAVNTLVYYLRVDQIGRHAGVHADGCVFSCVQA